MPAMKNGIGDRMKAVRTRRRLSLRELAHRANVSASLLSQIENGKANPSVESLLSIAAALQTPVTDIFSDTVTTAERPGGGAEAPALSASEFRLAQIRDARTPPSHEASAAAGPMITRQGERPTITLMGGVEWTRLTGRPEQDAEFLDTVYPPGSSSGAHMSHHSGREFALVLEGTMTIELGFECFTLEAGDTIVFNAPTPHRISNRSERPTRAIWVILNR
jgi:transcriptional regulator with XRE-family HTH domain